MEPKTIGSLLQAAAGYLRDKGSTSPRLDAELLLAEALGLERIHLYTEYDRPLSTAEVDRYRALIARRARHEPVAYILGRAHFRHLVLEVGPAVLIPRPETEELVDLALETLQVRPAWEALEGGEATSSAAGAGGRPVIADVGTGSGAIALSLAKESGLRVLATDVSRDALAVAARNRAAAGLERQVEFLCTHLLTGVADASLQLVVSNPPYVSSEEMTQLVPDVRLFEPVGALEAGPRGLDVLGPLLIDAARALMPGGSVIVEIGHAQAQIVSDLAVASGFALVTTRRDLSGKERFLIATLPGATVRDLSTMTGGSMEALAGALRAGALIGLPTDTVYGLAARWDCQAGVRRLFAAKGRDDAQPVAVIFPSVTAVKEALSDLDPRAEEVLRALLPGPFTFVVSTATARPPLVGTGDSLGVRVPDHPSLLDLLGRLGTGVAATSANLTGERPAATLAEVHPTLLAHCSVALIAAADGNLQRGAGRPSTVVDLRPVSHGQPPLILREGAVSVDEMRRRIEALRS